MLDKMLKGVIILLSIGLFTYLYKTPIQKVYSDVYTKYFPCQKPVTYRIGDFDSRFGLSQDEFISAIAEAEKIWEDAAQKNLFELTPNGDVSVNLVYDERQEATQKLKTLGVVVKENKASYDEVKRKFDSLQADYTKQKAMYETKIAEFEKAKKEYDAKVDEWNTKGGAPHDVFLSLEADRVALEKKLADIHARETNINKAVGNINATVVVLNRLAGVLNLDVTEFNKVGKVNGTEFTAGLYETGPEGEKISIYQFDSQDKLVRVLAHELGHAIGLSHLDNPKAIMYRLNEGVNDVITPDDLAELKAQCKLK